MRDLEPDQGMLTLRLTKRQVEVEDTRTEKVLPRHTTHSNNGADTALVWQSYNVVKLKRFVHQERTITIAQDIIKNESKASNKDTKKVRSTPITSPGLSLLANLLSSVSFVQPQRMIRDVKFAALVDKKPRLFNLQVRALAKIASLLFYRPTLLRYSSRTKPRCTHTKLSPRPKRVRTTTHSRA